MKNRKVQVYRVLGSKVSLVVAEHLEHSRPRQQGRPLALYRPLKPRIGQGSALKPEAQSDMHTKPR